MPSTSSRSRFWKRAIRSFRSQTWNRKRLLIGLENAGDLPALETGVSVIICPPLRSLGAKRNFINSQATGDYIAHWDDDDWSAPDRLARQIAESKTDVSGFRSALFWDEPTTQAYRYEGVGTYVIGSSLMYRRSYWQAHHFEGLNEGEDNGFVLGARGQNQLTALDGRASMVATSHNGNTSRRQYHTKQWHKADKSEIPEAYFET